MSGTLGGVGMEIPIPQRCLKSAAAWRDRLIVAEVAASVKACAIEFAPRVYPMESIWEGRVSSGRKRSGYLTKPDT